MNSRFRRRHLTSPVHYKIRPPFTLPRLASRSLHVSLLFFGFCGVGIWLMWVVARPVRYGRRNNVKLLYAHVSEPRTPALSVVKSSSIANTARRTTTGPVETHRGGRRQVKSKVESSFVRAETLHSLDVLQDFGDNTQGHPRVWRVPRLPPAAGSAPPPGVSVLARAVRTRRRRF